MISNDVVVYNNVINESERIILKDYAIDLLNNGELSLNTATPGNYRHYKKFYSLNEMSFFHKNLFFKIVAKLNLCNPRIDPLLGNIISIIEPNGFIQPHTDAYDHDISTINIKNKRNIRFNLMVERGEHYSYNPKINNEYYAVKKGDAWCFAASKLMHSTSKISGPENRIVYQFGFMLNLI